MKKITALLLAALEMIALFAGCSGSKNPAADESGVVKTGGSTSVEKVMLALIYQFQDVNREVTINYEGNGSGDGITNTISGLYEIGHSSRELKTDGTEDGLNAIPYAIDGIAVVVNKANPVEGLSKQQIFDIYTGVITNWSQVGGNKAPITVITRENNSGTRSAMADIIGMKEIVAGANEANSNGAVQTQVAQNANAIGYMSFSDVDANKVKAVRYEGVDISMEAIYSNDYQLKREFYLLTKNGAELSSAGQAFIDFVLSEAGQQIIADNKLLPIR